jgi:hypothetical protein
MKRLTMVPANDLLAAVVLKYSLERVRLDNEYIHNDDTPEEAYQS